MYPELRELSISTLVYANGENTMGESHFDGNAGTRSFGLSWKTDHTWVLVLTTLDDNGQCAQGWVDNAKMDRVRNDVENLFVKGDVLYGRWEAREPWVQKSGIGNFDYRSNNISPVKYNIIDDLNNAILRKSLADEDVQKFADFLAEYCKPANVFALRIRKMCKCGLTYITGECGRRVHFILDGLNVRKVVKDKDTESAQGVQRAWFVNKKYCTSAEMRRLMRQRMYDLRHRDSLMNRLGANYGINLSLVSFYLATEKVPAPWENGAPENWKWAWKNYIEYRKRKKETEL